MTTMRQSHDWYDFDALIDDLVTIAFELKEPDAPDNSMAASRVASNIITNQEPDTDYSLSRQRICGILSDRIHAEMNKREEV